jgi:hypothetical protein
MAEDKMTLDVEVTGDRRKLGEADKRPRRLNPNDKAVHIKISGLLADIGHQG